MGETKQMEKDEGVREGNAAKLRKEQRGITWREQEEHGRWKGNRLLKQTAKEEGRGNQSRRWRKEFPTTFAFYARDAARCRDAPINRRRDAGLSLSHFLSSSLLASPPASIGNPLRTRGWNYWDRAPSGAADAEGGSAGTENTSGYRSTTPLHASPLVTPLTSESVLVRPPLSISLAATRSTIGERYALIVYSLQQDNTLTTSWLAFLCLVIVFKKKSLDFFAELL